MQIPLWAPTMFGSMLLSTSDLDSSSGRLVSAEIPWACLDVMDVRKTTSPQDSGATYHVLCHDKYCNYRDEVHIEACMH